MSSLKVSSQRMQLRIKKILWVVAITLGIGLTLTGGYWTADSYPRYSSWRDLSLPTLKSSALAYYNGAAVCLYVVDCASGVARLRLVRNDAALDLEALKATIWRRRFERYCEGRTENIVIDTPRGGQGSNNDARWSFFNNRFITNHGHFQGSSASVYPFESCRKDNVTWWSDGTRLPPLRETPVK